MNPTSFNSRENILAFRYYPLERVNSKLICGKNQWKIIINRRDDRIFNKNNQNVFHSHISKQMFISYIYYYTQ